MKKNTAQKKHRYGFTLTEIAIVLGIMGVVAGAIWTVASNVGENQKENDAVNELQIISQNILSTMSGRTFSQTNQTNITSTITGTLAAPTGMVPKSYLNSSGTTINQPWSQGDFMIWTMGASGGAASNIFRISIYNPSYGGCLALLLQGTACQAGQIGCPTTVYTGGSSGVYTPNATANQAAASTISSTTASTLCSANGTTGGGSVEFDYATQ